MVDLAWVIHSLNDFWSVVVLLVGVFGIFLTVFVFMLVSLLSFLRHVRDPLWLRNQLAYVKARKIGERDCIDKEIEFLKGV